MVYAIKKKSTYFCCCDCGWQWKTVLPAETESCPHCGKARSFPVREIIKSKGNSSCQFENTSLEAIGLELKYEHTQYEIKMTEFPIPPFFETPKETRKSIYIDLKHGIQLVEENGTPTTEPILDVLESFFNRVDPLSLPRTSIFFHWFQMLRPVLSTRRIVRLLLKETELLSMLWDFGDKTLKLYDLEAKQRGKVPEHSGKTLEEKMGLSETMCRYLLDRYSILRDQAMDLEQIRTLVAVAGDERARRVLDEILISGSELPLMSRELLDLINEIKSNSGISPEDVLDYLRKQGSMKETLPIYRQYILSLRQARLLTEAYAFPEDLRYARALLKYGFSKEEIQIWNQKMAEKKAGEEAFAQGRYKIERVASLEQLWRDSRILQISVLRYAKRGDVELFRMTSDLFPVAILILQGGMCKKKCGYKESRELQGEAEEAFQAWERD